MARAPRPPWLLIAGQMKAATTSLHAMLDAHPALAGTRPKETEWWSYRAMDAHRFERRFAPQATPDQWIVDASVHATRATVEPDVLFRPFTTGRMEPPAHIVYVLRDEPSRIRSHAMHAFYHERFPRTKRAARACVEEAVRTSDIAARLAPWLEACPDARFTLLRFEDLVRDPAGAARAVTADMDLEDWSPPLRHDNDKDDQQPLAGPLRVLPGREKAIRLAKRVLGPRAASVRRLVGGRRGVPRAHPAIDAALADEEHRIAALGAANVRALRELEGTGRARWAGPAPRTLLAAGPASS